jgi:hypothetical protein
VSLPLSERKRISGSKRKLERQREEQQIRKWREKTRNTGEREYIPERDEMEHNRETEDRNIKI